jgi:hypothetical protein
MTEPQDVAGLPLAVVWTKADPSQWRDKTPLVDDGDEDDEDHPVPADVFALTGIDPDKEGWD